MESAFSQFLPLKCDVRQPEGNRRVGQAVANDGKEHARPNAAPAMHQTLAHVEKLHMRRHPIESTNQQAQHAGCVLGVFRQTAPEEEHRRKKNGQDGRSRRRRRDERKEQGRRHGERHKQDVKDERLHETRRKPFAAAQGGRCHPQRIEERQGRPGAGE